MSEQIHDAIAALADRCPKIFVGPRPGKKSFDQLKSLQLTHCCTLLSDREGAQTIRRISDRLGCQWVWLPIEGGKLEVLSETDLMGHLQTLTSAIADEREPRLYFHCSAGIHRTGFFVYSLLRSMGRDRDNAIKALTEIREVTAAQVGEERLNLADDMAARFLSGPQHGLPP